MSSELHPLLVELPDGVSEFTFAGLYLFRDTYRYELSWLPDGTLVIAGTKDGYRFLALPLGLPADSALRRALVADCDYFKGFSDGTIAAARTWFGEIGYEVHEDRDNFDYLYNREDLVLLHGKKFHKKRNLVNQFLNHYSYEVKPLNGDTRSDAYAVLDAWRAMREDDGDYRSCKESLELMDELHLEGRIVYADGAPAGFSMGESLAGGRAFVVHIEKAIPTYRGIYQFVNQAQAAHLSETYRFINREQDLGDAGLRQAKLTYRPCGYVRKYRAIPPGRVELLSRSAVAVDDEEEVAV